MSADRDTIKAYGALLADYPGVWWAYERTKKHNRLVICYKGQSRTQVFPRTPSCGRARLNGLADVRRLLRDLGAECRS